MSTCFCELFTESQIFFSEYSALRLESFLPFIGVNTTVFMLFPALLLFPIVSAYKKDEGEFNGH